MGAHVSDDKHSCYAFHRNYEQIILGPSPRKTSDSGRKPQHYVPLLYSIVIEALLYSIINDLGYFIVIWWSRDGF